MAMMTVKLLLLLLKQRHLPLSKQGGRNCPWFSHWILSEGVLLLPPRFAHGHWSLAQPAMGGATAPQSHLQSCLSTFTRLGGRPPCHPWIFEHLNLSTTFARALSAPFAQNRGSTWCFCGTVPVSKILKYVCTCRQIACVPRAPVPFPFWQPAHPPGTHDPASNRFIPAPQGAWRTAPAPFSWSGFFFNS